VATQKNSRPLSLVSFGATSAIVTGVGLIVGFGSAEVPKSVIISSLLIVGLADNLTARLFSSVARVKVKRLDTPRG